MPFIPPIFSDVDGSYSKDRTGLYLPGQFLNKKGSDSKAIAVSPYATSNLSLQQFIRAQIFQSRFKYFVMGAMYEKDTWIRACVDYIAKRATRDHNRLVDRKDPLNPDITDLETWLESCYEDGDFEDLYFGVVEDLLKYHQAYLYIEPTVGGERPSGLWPMDARITYPITDQHGTILFHVQQYNGHAEFFEKGEVLYFTLRNNNSAAAGISSLETLYASVAMEASANTYNQALFANNLNIGAIFSMPGANDEEIVDNDRYLKDKYSKPENAHRHLILKGDAKLLRDGVQAQKDIHFEELMKLARIRVCAVLGVPESLIGVPENTNRSTGGIHERSTYVNTVRPLRRLVNRQFTRQFIRSVWGSAHVRLEEPINSMLPTAEEIDAVAKVAEVGVKYNDLLEMLGLDRVPNGEYYIMKIPGGGGYVRLDTTAMPGLGDPHFDFAAYEAEHESSQVEAQNFAAQGFQAPAPAVPYVPPRPQDMTQREPIAARIIDISRSLGEWEVSRRTPTVPGARGGNFYVTGNGGIRYGTPPANAGAGGSGKDENLSMESKRKKQRVEHSQAVGGRALGAAPAKHGQASDGDKPGMQVMPDGKFAMTPPLTGKQQAAQASPSLPPLSLDERLSLDAARIQVGELLRQAQNENLDNKKILSLFKRYNWQPSEDNEPLSDVRDARDYARYLAERDPSFAYVVVGAEGEYRVLMRPLDEFGDGPDLDNDGAGAEETRPVGGGSRPAQKAKHPAHKAPVQRSLGSPTTDEYIAKLEAFLRGGSTIAR